MTDELISAIPHETLERFAEDAREVEILVAHELARMGDIEAPDDWRFADVLVSMRPSGEPTATRLSRGRAAALLGALFNVHDAIGYAAGPHGSLAEAAAWIHAWCTQLGDVLNDPRTQHYLRNLETLDQASTGRTSSQLLELIESLERMKEVAGVSGRAVEALAGREPRAVLAGLYDATGAGPLTHFMLELHDLGFTTTEIASIWRFRELKRKSGVEREDELDRAIDAVKGRLKRHPDFHPHWKTVRAQRNVSVDDLVFVLSLAHDDARPRLVADLRSRFLLPGADGNSSPLDPDGPPPESTPGP